VRKSERPRTPREVSGKWLALALALLVQGAFVAVLIFSVRWQNRKPEAVTAELYAPPSKTQATAAPPQPAPAPAPAPTPIPQPEPKVSPQPVPATPPAVTPPEPKVEKPDPAADIARKARADEERKKKAEALRREEEAKSRAQQEALERQKAEEKKKLDAKQQETRARQQRETEAMRAQAENEADARARAERDAQSRTQQSTQRAKAEADWIRSIQAKVRGNVIVPPDMAGNPEAIFEVVQLPTGEIIDAQLRKSSGVRAYDDAVQRAILKSSPLPRPERADLFQRSLTLKFRPTD
jgi:colicin import membrane protein